jgi:C1A family cysteine protease
VKLFTFIAVYFSLALQGCIKSKEDPFNPVFDLGLVAATEADLRDAALVLPNYYTGILPASHSLNMPPVGDQKKQGSCIAFSAGYAVMGYYINRSSNGNYSATYLASPKFLYNQCKISSDCMSGSNYPRALSVLKDKGICTWADMPYNDAECSQQPTISQLNFAARYRLRSWSYIPLTNIDILKRYLMSGYPLMVAISVYDNLFGYSGGLYNSFSGVSKGGHAVCIVGYNENSRAFKIQNSWGSGWGDNGNFWVTYDFLAHQLALEKWCYVAVPNF